MEIAIVSLLVIASLATHDYIFYGEEPEKPKEVVMTQDFSTMDRKIQSIEELNEEILKTIEVKNEQD
jgi:hypothetical protein